MIGPEVLMTQRYEMILLALALYSLVLMLKQGTAHGSNHLLLTFICHLSILAKSSFTAFALDVTSFWDVFQRAGFCSSIESQIS